MTVKMDYSGSEISDGQSLNSSISLTSISRWAGAGLAALAFFFLTSFFFREAVFFLGLLAEIDSMIFQVVRYCHC